MRRPRIPAKRKLPADFRACKRHCADLRIAQQIIDVADQLVLRACSSRVEHGARSHGPFHGTSRGELGAVVGEAEQSLLHKVSIRERESIDGGRIEDGDLVGEVRDRRLQPSG